MAHTRFTCTLTTADQPACTSYARVTITDAEGGTARGCPRHAVAALDGITGARVDWADSKGLNEHERLALELSEERSQLAAVSHSAEMGSHADERHADSPAPSVQPRDEAQVTN